MVQIVDPELKPMITFVRLNKLLIVLQNLKQLVIMYFNNFVLLKTIQHVLKTMDIYATIHTILDNVMLF